MGRLKLTIEEMQEIADKRGGNCLSMKYVDNRTKLEWTCEKKHIWWATPGHIKRERWCPHCAGTKKLTIKEMQEIAKNRGGKCLSTEYISNDTKLEWQCADGHRWLATPHSVKRGSWCPKCTNFIGEKIFRMNFECVFQESFLKARPKWLTGEYKVSLELDAYCKKLKLAGEYNGKHWHKDKISKNRDKLTVEGCKKQGVSLLTIDARNNYENIIDDIITECDIHNILLPNPICYIYYKDLPIYLPSKLMEMHEIAENNGGKCLSTEYINNNTKLEWECAEGHRWFAIPSSIKLGSWCLVCSGRKKGTITDMQKLAKDRGGKCLSTKYINSKTKLEWQCANGHTWWATPSCIQREQWCPICNGGGSNSQNYYITQYQKIARKRNGKCLSKKYINNRKKLEWECIEGHRWFAIPNSIQQGSWCPICGRKKQANSRRKKSNLIRKV